MNKLREHMSIVDFRSAKDRVLSRSESRQSTLVVSSTLREVSVLTRTSGRGRNDGRGRRSAFLQLLVGGLQFFVRGEDGPRGDWMVPRPWGLNHPGRIRTLLSRGLVLAATLLPTDAALPMLRGMAVPRAAIPFAGLMANRRNHAAGRQDDEPRKQAGRCQP